MPRVMLYVWRMDRLLSNVLASIERGRVSIKEQEECLIQRDKRMTEEILARSWSCVGVTSHESKCRGLRLILVKFSPPLAWTCARPQPKRRQSVFSRHCLRSQQGTMATRNSSKFLRLSVVASLTASSAR